MRDADLDLLVVHRWVEQGCVNRPTRCGEMAENRENTECFARPLKHRMRGVDCKSGKIGGDC